MIFLTPFLLAALSCPATISSNVSSFPWNADDTAIQKLTVKRCAHHYPRSPCLIKFQKYGYKDYRVVCGAKR
jgi:hypothetical protein